MPTRSGGRVSLEGRVATLTLGAAITTLAWLTLALAYTDGPPLAHTGGFGEPTCHRCHFDAPINEGEVSLEFMRPEIYEPERAYELEVALRRNGLARGGFQLTARFASGGEAGTQAGSLRPVDNRVRVVTAESGVQYAQHSEQGSQPTSERTAAWTVLWEAPSEAAGPVVVHLAANAANGDDSEFGDFIQADSSIVLPKRSSGRAEPDVFSMTSGTDAEFRGLSAAGPSVVWATGRGGVYARSLDGGATWSAGTIPGAAELFLIDVHAVDARTAYVLGTHFDGGRATIFKTTDGGVSWMEQFVAEGAGVFFDGMAFWNDENGVAFSDPVDGSFLIVVTSDGGATWSRVPPESIPPPLPGEAGFAASGTAITVSGERHVWFGTGGASVARVLRSSDRGRTWTAAETPLPAGSTAGVFGVAFRDSVNGVIVGGDYREPRARGRNVARTTDGGRTWRLAGTSEPAGVRYGTVYTPSVPYGSLLVAVGPSGWGYSADDGTTWTAIDTLGLNTVAASPEGRAWAAGLDGRIRRLDF